MIRSVARATARVVAKPSSTRATTLHCLASTPLTSTSNPAASFATSSSPPATTSTAQPPANLRSLKRDIARLIDEDTADLATAPDQGLLDYVKEQGMRITQDKEGLIKLARTVGDYNVVVQFMAEVDEDGEGEEGEDGEGAEKPEGEEGEEGREDDEEDAEASRLPAHQWEVDITNTVAPQHNTLRLACLTSKQGQYSIEAITFDPAPPAPSAQQSAGGLDLGGVDERKQLYFDELSEATQDKMFELLESLGVDDKLGQFVQHYSQVVRTQGYLDKLKMLKQFLQQ